MVRTLCVSVRTYQIATGFWVLLREFVCELGQIQAMSFPQTVRKERKKERKKEKKGIVKKPKKTHNLLTWRNSLLLGRSITHAALIN